MRMPPYVFFLPDGSRQTVYCITAKDAEVVANQLGAVAHGLAADTLRIEATLYGHRVLASVEAFLERIERPANRLPASF